MTEDREQRQARLAAALRDNLARRKAQARQRSAAGLGATAEQTATAEGSPDRGALPPGAEEIPRGGRE